MGHKERPPALQHWGDVGLAPSASLPRCHPARHRSPPHPPRSPSSSCLPGATAWIKWTRRDSRKEAGHSREGIGVGAAERCPPSRGPLLLGFPQPRGHRAGGPVAARAPAFTLAGPGSPALSRKTPPSLFWGPLSHDTPQPPSSTCLLTQEPPQEPPSIRGPGPLRDGSSAGAG